MSKNHFPGADTTAQYWAGKFIGSTMNTNCICLHTTETSTWPGYGSGASAPHMTIRPNIATKTVSIRQHFPAGMSSRALVNLSGGVETNTLNVFQIELIGTCDSRYRVSRSEWGVAGVDYIYWPDAPDWLIEAIAPVVKWLDAEWPDFKIADATPRGWVRYPDSYGLHATQRMTFSEWANAYGIFGHQHVPENTHGDPGNFPIAKLVSFAKGTVPVPVPVPAPTPTPVPAPTPEPVPSSATIRLLFLPMAGYNADSAPGVTRWEANTRGLLGIVTNVKPDLIGTTELSNRAIAPMRPMFDAGAPSYSRVSGGSDGRYIYRRKSTTTHIASGHVLASDSSELNDDDKQAAWSVDEVDGVRVRTIAFHGENEDGIDRSSGVNADDLRVAQAISVEQRALKAMAPYATSGPIIYMGDFNSEGMVRDAMVARGWTVAGYGNFTGWADNVKKPLAWVFIKGGTAAVRRIYHDFSDHTSLDIVATVPK